MDALTKQLADAIRLNLTGHYSVHKQTEALAAFDAAKDAPKANTSRISNELTQMAHYIEVNPDNAITDTLWHGPAETTMDALLRLSEEVSLLEAPAKADLQNENDELRKERDTLLECIADLRQWSKAYPTTVFREPDFKRAAEVLSDAGMTLDALSASTCRLILGDIIRRLDRHQPPSAVDTQQPHDDAGNRCAACGWTYAKSAKEGCVPGDCSLRPFPHPMRDEARYRSEQQAAVDTQQVNNDR